MSAGTLPSPIPGVYRQEVFPKPAPVLPTGVPLFVGFLAAGPAMATLLSPQRLTHWPQFIEKVDKIHRRPSLDAAVHGFFANGGELCYVVMVYITAAGVEVALQSALETAEDVAEIDLVCVPDLWAVAETPEAAQRSQQLILEHCDRTNDRFALLDTPLVTNPTQIDSLRPSSRLQGSNGALYGPWLKSQQSNDWVPPCGHVAGMIAQCDRAIGVHRAPANLVLEDALDLSVGISDADQHQLNPAEQPAGVNCLRSLTGRGIRVWGARTLSAHPLGCYVSGRRLLITVCRWAALTLADVAFEPNDIALWIRIEREFALYLESLARQGALQGQTASEAFFVKCDAETNPPAERDLGRVVTLVGLAPAVPGEFIVVRLIHGDRGVTLTSVS
ncbi:phage tail sheath family protein [Leptolyngbya sp. AN02str]|uniref:phage tail sheath family protein n=1 Tax=Leptolyngbya sp. AN02str TaxID=3423363 RepID=UPI003D31FBF1